MSAQLFAERALELVAAERARAPEEPEGHTPYGHVPGCIGAARELTRPIVEGEEALDAAEGVSDPAHRGALVVGGGVQDLRGVGAARA